MSMQIYIISVEEQSSLRWMNFINQPFFYNQQDLYTKIGVKGGEMSAKQYFELAVKGRSHPLSPGELGCTLSHLEAMKQFLNSDEQLALVLEDDAIIPDELTLAVIEAELKKMSLPSNILFSLGGIQMKECRKVRGEIKQKFLSKSVLEVVPDFFHRACYAFAYVVDRSMAQTLLNYHTQIRKADDWSYLYDFDQSVHLYMSFVVDHPQIEPGESNTLLSHLELERSKFKDLEKSRYGTTVKKNIAKITSKKYL